MAFNPEELPAHITFTEKDKVDVKVVEGHGHSVHWENCKAITSMENAEKKRESKLSGTVKLESGTSLYFVGGFVKEE